MKTYQDFKSSFNKRSPHHGKSNPIKRTGQIEEEKHFSHPIVVYSEEFIGQNSLLLIAVLH